MARGLGELVVSLGLDASDFTSGLTKAERDAQRFAKTLRNDVSIAASALGGILGGISVGVLVKTFESAVEGVAKFKQLSEQVGDTAVAFAGLQSSALTSGVAVNDIASASIRLTSALAKTDDEGTQAGKAIKALGLNLNEFKALSPVAQIEAFSKALARFADDGGKSAVAVAAFGKQGAQLIPFFNDLAEAGGRNVRLTQEQIEAADKFTKELAALKGQIALVVQAIAIDMIPAISGMLKEMRDGIVVAGGFVNALRLFGTLDLGKPEKEIASLGKELERLEAKKAKGGLLTDFFVDSDIADVKKKLEFMILQVKPSFRDLVPDIKPQLKPDLSNKKKATDDPTSKILQGQIKALEASIARERDILGARQDFLRDYYQDGRLSLAQFYDQLQEARSTNLANTLAALDKEIDLAQEAKRRALKATDKEGFQNIADAAREKQTTLTLQAGFAEEALARERARSTEQYGFALDELNAKMLDLAGNTAKAASIRFDVQNAVFKRSLGSSGDAGALAQLAQIKNQTVIQSQLNDETKKFNLVLDGVGIAQERINLLQQTGAISELDALSRSSALNRSIIADLQRRADVLAEIAAKSQDPADLQKVERMRLEIERLGAATDLVADKFNNIFSGAFSDAIQALASGTKSFKDAAKDLGKSIVGSINKIAADEIASKLFGKGGLLSGAGDFASKLFGKGAEATGAAAITAAGTTLTASGTLLTTSGTLLTTAGTLLTTSAGALTAAAATLAASAAADAASSALSGIANIGAGGLGGLAFAANGTNFSPGGATMVGEHGPEILNLPRGAQVIPINRAKGGSSVNVTNHIHPPPGASTQSMRQFAAMVRDMTVKSIKER